MRGGSTFEQAAAPYPVPRLTHVKGIRRPDESGHQFAHFVWHQSWFVAQVNPKTQRQKFSRRQKLVKVMTNNVLEEPALSVHRRPLTEADAIDIWTARWLRVRPKELVRRYQCDPRRLYEIWEETKFPGSRAKALTALRLKFPGLQDRFDPGPHRRLSFAPDPRQLTLFPAAAEGR